MSLVKIPSSTFFLLFFLFSLHWHFLKCFSSSQCSRKMRAKEYLWAIKLAKHWCLRRFIILISLLKSLWSLTVNLHNCGESKVSKLFGLQNAFHQNRYLISSCLRQTCLLHFNIFESTQHLITNGIFKSQLASYSHDTVGSGPFLCMYKHGHSCSRFQPNNWMVCFVGITHAKFNCHLKCLQKDYAVTRH